MLTIRQQRLLKLVIENYIKSAEPIASGFLVDKIKEDISSATVRIEMAELERAGYIFQPHISAGRIPTERAYRFYLGGILAAAPSKRARSIKRTAAVDRVKVKTVARKLADDCGLAVLAAFGDGDFYYTGLSNLFNQPEFREQARVVNVAALVENFDRAMKTVYNKFLEPRAAIGKDSLFGESCSFIAGRSGEVLLSILGPTRMDYKKNFELILSSLKRI